MTTRIGKARIGGFSRGCTIVLVIVLVIIGLIAGGLAMVYFKTRSFTSAAPVKIPVVQVSEEQYQSARGRMEAIRKAFKGEADPSNPEGKFEVSAEDLCAMISRDPELSKVRDKFGLAIENNLLKIQTSVPLDGVPGFKGRFLNGTITASLSVEKGQVQVAPQVIEVNGKPAPATFVEPLKQSFTEGFQQAIRDNPELNSVMERIESLKIENNRVKIRIPPSASAPAPAPAPTPTDAKTE
jgi:hypothetical protein